MNKLTYFFKNCLRPFQENLEAWKYLVLEKEDDCDGYLDGEVIIYIIDDPSELVDLFYNELDWFAPSNRWAEDFFYWY
jgi:hypothetical protein